jgi:hypothetical protein
VTEDEEFSKDFLQDFKNMAACAERICKKVQDMMEDKSVPTHYIIILSKIKNHEKKAMSSFYKIVKSLSGPGVYGRKKTTISFCLIYSIVNINT